jgi:ASC-1-like (ASCH) protein
MKIFGFVRYLFALITTLLLAPIIFPLHLISIAFCLSKPTRAHIDGRWMKKILNGQKTHEGRLCKGRWEFMISGYKLVLYSDDYEVKVLVETVQHYTDFGSAYEAHPDTLLPSRKVTSVEEAEDVYREWYSDEDVKEYGVVVFGISVDN